MCSLFLTMSLSISRNKCVQIKKRKLEEGKLEVHPTIMVDTKNGRGEVHIHECEEILADPDRVDNLQLNTRYYVTEQVVVALPILVAICKMARIPDEIKLMKYQQYPNPFF